MQATTMCNCNCNCRQARRLTGNKWCMQICGMLPNVHILAYHLQVSHATGFCPVRFSTLFIHFLRLDAAVFCATNADRTFSFVFIIISTHHKRTFYCTQLKIKPNYGVKDSVQTQTHFTACGHKKGCQQQQQQKELKLCLWEVSEMRCRLDTFRCLMKQHVVATHVRLSSTRSK